MIYDYNEKMYFAIASDTSLRWNKLLGKGLQPYKSC